VPAAFVVDLTDVKAPISSFPNGPVEATIVSAEADIAKSSGNTKLTVEFEVYHPDYGTARIFDTLPSVGFARKVAAFWMALNDWGPEDLAASPQVRIEGPELKNAQLVINLGEQERRDQPGRMRKAVVEPWYWSIAKGASLLTSSQDPL